MTLSSSFFDVTVFLLSRVVVTGPRLMPISLLVPEVWQFLLVRDWPDPEVGNIPVWVLPNIWGLGRVTDSKFFTIVSNKKLLNAAKCQGYRFYRVTALTYYFHLWNLEKISFSFFFFRNKKFTVFINRSYKILSRLI